MVNVNMPGIMDPQIRAEVKEDIVDWLDLNVFYKDIRKFYNSNQPAPSELAKFIKNKLKDVGHSVDGDNVWHISHGDKVNIQLRERPAISITYLEYAKMFIFIFEEENSTNQQTELVVSEEYSRAVSLDRRIKANAQAAQESLYEVCKGLKEMRDGKLYKELGYENFEEYSEHEVGMSKRNANRYVAIAEMLESGTPVSQNIGATKLYLLSTLSEPDREEILQNNNVEDMSKRELEAQIKQLKAENEKMNDYTKELAGKINEANREKEEAEKKAQQMTGHLSVLKTDKNMLTEANEQLKAKIKELEDRPVDVAVADSSEEIEKLREEYEDQLATMNGELIANKRMVRENSAAAHEALKEVEKLKKQLAEKPKEVEVTDYEDVFNIYLNAFNDAGRKFLYFVKQHHEYKASAMLWVRDMAKEFEK